MTQHTLTLSSGYEMPVVGLGTWQSLDEDVENAVTTALECGYRHIDGAFMYENEEAIGRSLKKWFDEGNEREELFITTKLPNYGMKESDVETYLNLSLERLGLDYVDLYLIHTPFGFEKDPENHAHGRDEDGEIILDCDTDHLAIWKAMEAQVESGRIKSIGVANFNEAQILNLIENSDIKPCNLQIEIHAYHQQRPIREFCEKNNIVVTAYSSLGSLGTPNCVKSDSTVILPSLLELPVVQEIAEAHGKTTAQVLLRHQVQGGLIVIPKSVRPERIAQNIEIFDFELSDDEMQQLDEIDKGDEGRIFHFVGFFSKVESHPEYPF